MEINSNCSIFKTFLKWTQLLLVKKKEYNVLDVCPLLSFVYCCVVLLSWFYWLRTRCHVYDAMLWLRRGSSHSQHIWQWKGKLDQGFLFQTVPYKPNWAVSLSGNMAIIISSLVFWLFAKEWGTTSGNPIKDRIWLSVLSERGISRIAYSLHTSLGIPEYRENGIHCLTTSFIWGFAGAYPYRFEGIEVSTLLELANLALDRTTIGLTITTQVLGNISGDELILFKGFQTK